ncbi:hypothetical protein YASMINEVIRUS_652 [Yasminevirus sp. GU-2018]|uniref:Uncharacterized protein n=1 Tax=Yasminevirus sp. GU-2018 TaxID=2420051 RepID=A0A5K0U7Z4_9VIRU|nr:hypothetical protein YASMINEVIRUS_652 [Yasminevirus sp. GU-2018]
MQQPTGNTQYQDFNVESGHKRVAPSTLEQYGGGYLLNDQISANVEAIVRGDYKLMSEMDKVKNMSYSLDNCIDADSLFDDPASGAFPMYYKQGRKMKCFIRQPNVTDKDLEKDTEYKFKKQFSLDLTDIFMQKTLTPEDLSVATNYIYYTFDFALSKLLDVLVKDGKFGAKTELLTDHVYLLYKGGNTTRLLLKNFVRETKHLIGLRGHSTAAITDAVSKLDELVGGFNIGDWDYMMKIDFDYLKANGFTDPELNELIMLLMQTFYYVASYIKEKISDLLKSKGNTFRYSQAIQDYIKDKGTTDKITSFVQEYNKFTKTGPNTIDDMKIKDVIVYDNAVTTDKIDHLDRARLIEIYRDSFAFKITGKLKNYKGKRVTYAEYFEVDAPFVDETNMTYLPEHLSEDVVYIAYMSNLGFCRRYALSSFNLIRLKVLNMLNFDMKFTGHAGPVEKTMFVNAELVDCSVSNVNDCKGVYNNHYYYPGHEDMETAHIVDEAFKKERVEVKIPSVQMMFADICHMLFTENLFVWEDPKYAKRIKRLFFLSLPCMYKDNMRTKQILAGYRTMQQLFKDLNAIPDIDGKLALLNGHYDIVISPYNALINDKTQHNVTPAFMALGTVHRLVVIAPGSPYKIRYLEYLLANYIRMLIIAKYIISDQVDPQHQELVKYELQIHRILELENITDYIKPYMTTLTPSLSNVYKSVRGTTHSLIGGNLVQLGPMGGLPPADPTAVAKFFDPRATEPQNDKALKPYEETIVKSADYIMTILNGLIDAGVGRIKPRYVSASLF